MMTAFTVSMYLTASSILAVPITLVVKVSKGSL